MVAGLAAPVVSTKRRVCGVCGWLTASVAAAFVVNAATALRAGSSRASWALSRRAPISLLGAASRRGVMTMVGGADKHPLLKAIQKPKVIFVLGGPGAGKGTQCAKLVEECGFVHLSAGELLRRERLSGSADGQLINEYIAEGKIVPVRISLSLLLKEMAAYSDRPATRFLVDGFPRNFDNVQGWEEMVGNGQAELERVLCIECPEDELIGRLVKRGETSGRSDDNVETARKRFHTYDESTRPVIAHYEKQDKVIRVPGWLSVDDVYARIRRSIQPLIEKEILSLTELLLWSISEGDWDVYKWLCADDMTCFEPEARGHLVEGLPFHKFYFDNGNALGKHVSNIVDPRVYVMGKSAVMTYIRVVQKTSLPSSASGGASAHAAQIGVSVSSFAHEETRVWHVRDGRWQCVHFHRSPSH